MLFEREVDSSQFYLGDWQVSPASNSLRLGKTVSVIEPRAMDVLLFLCQQAGNVVNAETIVNQCWGGEVVGDNPIHKSITQLRRALGDKANTPIYIETIRKRGYRVIADVVFPQDDQARAEKSQWQGSSPFPGLKAFTSDDAGVFFGRQSQIEHILERLTEQLKRNHALTLLLGASGSGKSSLIHAGLIPRLMAPNGIDGVGVVSAVTIDFADVIAENLWQHFASCLLDWDVNDAPVFEGHSAESLAQVLQTDIGQVCELCQLAIRNSPAYSQPKLLLVLDRLEVLLDAPQYSSAVRSAFLTMTDALAGCHAIIIFAACRNEFYPQLTRYPMLMRGKDKGAHFDLAPPSPHELSQMIRLPAIAAKLEWDIDSTTGMPLDDLLVLEATSQPDALPLLQYTLQELYEQRTDNQLQASVYRELGGIEGAIGHKAEEIFAAMKPDNQHAFPHVLSLLITLSHDTSNLTSRTARWEELKTPAQHQFVQSMVDNRLFVSRLQNQQPCFQVAHEALLRCWSRVTDWITRHKTSLAIRSRLHQQADNWLAEQKSTAYLLAEGKPLQEAKSLLEVDSFTLLPHELALIKASSNKARTRRWLKRATLGLLAILTSISLFMSLQSQHAQQIAEQKRQEAESLLGFMVGEFADKLRSVKRMDLLDGISAKAIEYFSTSEALTEDHPWWALFTLNRSTEGRFQRALTLQALAEVAYSRGNSNEARQSFTAAGQQLNKLWQKDKDNPELLQALGVNAFWRGQLDYDAGHYQQALPAFEQYLAYSERLVAVQPGNTNALAELSYAHNTLGSLALKQQKYKQALTELNHSLTLKKQLIENDTGNVALLADIADTYSWLASTARHLGDITAALDYFSQGQQRLEKALKVDSDNAYTMESLALLLWQHANLRELTGQISRAVSLAEGALHYLDALVMQDADNLFWQQDRRSVQLLLIRLNTKLPDQHKHLTQTEVNQQVSAIRASGALAGSDYLNLARIYQLRRHFEQKHSMLEKANDWLQSLDSATDTQDAVFFAQFQMLLAHPAEALQTPDKQAQYCQRAVDALAPYTRVSKDPQTLLLFVRASQCASDNPDVTSYVKQLTRQGISLSLF
ncbi:nSTAND1 domain-containing NTPase [Lacimicrobium alkaliphilum]|uniref:Transcriptional regulator n=1 Tax=Lacimicrobium alkaliphilum TaxID=1526571 RepID=A0ABQ1RMJ2_9ALTE|nr:winged helix-turn-helix domain-containing protein [Lacimicrobium alkaliphilum]GGD74927.1 transcriptional regulator [Lacimicrobium alkaliphilum]